MEQLHAFDCHQNVAEPQATENHRNCESGLVIIYKHAAHRLVQHRLQVVEMAWTDYGTLAIFFFKCYSTTGSIHRAIVWSPVNNTGTVSQATKTNRIDRSPCNYNIALATEWLSLSWSLPSRS